MVQFTSDVVEIGKISKIEWPEGKTFAFTIFDDPDFQTPENAAVVYELLADCGLRTTKGVWPGKPGTPAADTWGTCLDAKYLEWTLGLQEIGFEIGWHGSSPTTSSRAETIAGLEKFKELFGKWPETMSQHYHCDENLYWGDARISGKAHRFVYNLLTQWKNHNKFYGDKRGHDLYWSDLCQKHVSYVRNFVFGEINTLSACPLMPYHDPERPDVNYWYASSEGHNVKSFTKMLSCANQDKLEADSGACIMYTHFAYGFADHGKLNPAFRSLIERLSKKNGWFVPIATLLEYIAEKRGQVQLTPRQRAALERKWLQHKIRYGTA